MSDISYRVLRFDELTVERNNAEQVAKAVKANSASEQTVGIWIPLIGVSSNVVTVDTNWTVEPPKADYKDAKIVSVRTRLFDVLARGQHPCTAEGIYTHRWFVVTTENVKALTDTSVEAWKSSEEDTEMRIAGFWRCRELNASGQAVILMIVYYPSLAAWDASRYWKPKPKDQEQPNRNVWGGLFNQRRDMLMDSWVTVHRLVM